MNPTQNRLLVRVQAEVVKKGEEIKGDSAMRAEVLKVGPKVEDIKKGDMVVFAPYGIDEIMVGKEKLILVVEDLILGTYEQQKSNTKAKR